MHAVVPLYAEPGASLRERALFRVRHAIGLPYVHFLHVGKTGGSAVKGALRGARAPSYRIVLQGHDMTLGDVPARDRCFFFVRDPIRRFVSGFYSRQRQGAPRVFIPWSEAEAAAFQMFATPNELAVALSDADPVRRDAAAQAVAAIPHLNEPYAKWLGGPGELLERAFTIMFVGSQERLDDDFERLKEILELPGSVTLPRDDVTAHRNPANLDTAMSDEARANVSAWYGADYELLDILASRFPNLPRYTR